MKTLKDWDIVWVYGTQHLMGWAEEGSEVLTSEVVSREGDTVHTYSGMVYQLEGDRRRRTWAKTGFLSVGGLEDHQLRDDGKNR